MSRKTIAPEYHMLTVFRRDNNKAQLALLGKEIGESGHGELLSLRRVTGRCQNWSYKPESSVRRWGSNPLPAAANCISVGQLCEVPDVRLHRRE